MRHQDVERILPHEQVVDGVENTIERIDRTFRRNRHASVVEPLHDPPGADDFIDQADVFTGPEADAVRAKGIELDGVGLRNRLQHGAQARFEKARLQVLGV